ncbi:hypothetical protein LCGC14_2224010 [marine sediment metagenome]|uniref:Uncharacterized protein n=1 Tax=marine sediment metagenome TaxID=412755 RepID=A0A0F9DA66_9ZZZZ
MKMKRAVGYCTNPICDEHARPMFLLNPKEKFQCGHCQWVGKIEHERGYAENTQPIFKEVRVRFAYSRLRDCYAETAIVRDESLWGRNNVYHYTSPMLRTEKHALKVAEQILATLSQMSELPNGNELPNFFENHLNWDADLETFKQECETWGESLRDTPLTRSE